MQRLEVSGALRLIYRSLDVKGLINMTFHVGEECAIVFKENCRRK